MQGKTCPKCGKEMTAVQDYCPGCGEKLAWTEAERQQVVRDGKRREGRKAAKVHLKLTFGKVLADLAISMAIAFWVSRQLGTGFWITYAGVLVAMTWLFNMF